MAKLEVLKYGNPILRKKAVEIKEITEEIKALCKDMFEAMYSVSGVGLAAPQVGHSIRLCIIDVSKDKNTPIVMINPKIIEASNKILMEEGCLSFPGFYESVKRFENISAQYMDLKGVQRTIKASGFLAKAIQHEIDHLDAKLFIDYMDSWKRKNLEKEIRRKKKAGQW
jgi:peptide deformylase